jgi:hypothetical protein
MRLPLFSLACWASIIPAYASDGTKHHNANHIFNAIHASMRHLESSLYSNGMSFFLATAPKGTEFYHGTGYVNPIKGVEWLAFEPEHSLGFAHRSESPPHGRPHNPGLSESERAYEQQPLESTESHNNDAPAGYLHTYAAAKDLRLLYLDGMSGIDRDGSADAQDRILFNDSIKATAAPFLSESLLWQSGEIGGPPDEQRRAILACQMARDIWDDRIDGLIRTEGDFEIILCNFERDLELVHITRTKPQPKYLQKEKSPKTKKVEKGRLDMHSSSFGDLSGSKIIVDFDYFVTVFTYNLDLFPDGDESAKPRLNHIPSQELEPIRQAINTMILTQSPQRHPYWNLQAVTDSIIRRFSGKLRILAEGQQFSSIDALRADLENFLEPFIDYRDFNNMSNIVHRCQEHYIPTTAPGYNDEILAVEVLKFISRQICVALTEVLLDDEGDLETVASRFQGLVAYLGWPEN